MTVPGKRILLPLLIPVVTLASAFGLVRHWPSLQPDSPELQAFMVLLPLLPFALFGLAAAFGLRYGNAGLILATMALSLTYAFAESPGDGASTGGPARQTVLFLLPLNLALFSTLMKRRLKTVVGGACLLAVAVQSAGVLWLSRRPDPALEQAFGAIAPDGPAGKALAAVGRLLAAAAPVGDGSLTAAAAAVIAASLAFLAVRFWLRKNALTAGLAGALAAAVFALAGGQGPPAATVYFSAAGLMLAAAGIETSFALAYTDELTGLPGRRRLNEALVNLGRRYSLAMVDVDHFKKFNDRYGHDAGDQVLRMIAGKLGEVAGGGKAFRYGGEEFTIVFTGKGIQEALPHLERCRRKVASAGFVVRGKQRKRSGPDQRGRRSSSGTRKVPVTVSIGLAQPPKGVTDPAQVLKAADQALYRAKKAGRNRIRMAEGG